MVSSAYMTKAGMRYVWVVKAILDLFEEASGLRFVWEKTKAAFLPEGPPSMPFWLLPWTWEQAANVTKSLGYHVAGSFSVGQMENQVHTRITNRICKLKKHQLSLAGRITAANSLILSTIWYVLTLWARDLSFLKKLQTLVEAFVWAGRSRVCQATATQYKSRGGLGLIMITEQYRAIAGNLFMWVLGQETHPLRHILSSHLWDLSQRKWGVADFTWVVSKGGGKKSLGSPVWRNICLAWSSLKSLLTEATPRNAEEWGLLPVWCPH